MTESDWKCNDDAGLMLDYVWERHAVPMELDRLLHRYYLACCRSIWELLPQEASRRGVELAEQFLEGIVSADEVNEYNWHVEGAAFCIDYNCDPEAIDRWVAEVRALPDSKLLSMIHPTEVAREIEPRDLLTRAAYFADYAMIYSSITPKGPPPDTCRVFLSAQMLRNFIDYPFPIE